MKHLVVCFDDGTVLAIITHEPHLLMSDVLDWYAREYDFERRRIAGGYGTIVPCTLK